jgi:hypothetical protein
VVSGTSFWTAKHSRDQNLKQRRRVRRCAWQERPYSYKYYEETLKPRRQDAKKMRLKKEEQSLSISHLREGAAPKTINLEVGTLRGIPLRNRLWEPIQQDLRMLKVEDTAEPSSEPWPASPESRALSRTRSQRAIGKWNDPSRYSYARLAHQKQRKPFWRCTASCGRCGAQPMVTGTAVVKVSTTHAYLAT